MKKILFTCLLMFLMVLASVITGICVYGCKKEEPVIEDTEMIKSASLEDKLYKKTKIAFVSTKNPMVLKGDIFIRNSDGTNM